jgi:Carboxypeptidase regulatory-like domain
VCSNRGAVLQQARTGSKTERPTGNASRFLLLFFACLMWHPAWGQVSGRFLGTVTDAGEAAVPNATVTLHNANTGLVRETKTNQSGYYEILALPAAEGYAITAEAPGFEKIEQTGLKLLVSQEFRVNFKLPVGKVAATVEVSSAPVQVETDSTQLGQVIEGKAIEALPLNGRSYIDLLGLQTGVIPTSNPSPFQPSQPASGFLGEGELSVNGQRENANGFLVNGAPVEDTGSNGAGVIPVLDSIQEFRLLTNSFDAEFGGFSGAIVSVVTKSGSNEFHGSAFEFLRNESLDAKNFFDSTRGAFQRNQFGGAIGGPILKNHLFFFGDYQGTRQNRGLSTGTVLVPSAAQRSGDLSSLASLLKGTVRGDNAPGHFADYLSAALGYPVVAGEPYYVPGCGTVANAQAGTCVFPNAQIPQSIFSSAAVGVLKFFPAPTNNTGNGQFPSYTSSSEVQNIVDNKWALRIDTTLKGNHDLSFYYHYDGALIKSPLGAGNVFGSADNVPGFAYTEPSLAQLFVISDTKVISSTKVNEAHLSWHRIAFPGPKPTGGLGKVSSFGFTEGGLGLLPSRANIEGLPSVILNQLGLTVGAAVTDGSYQNNYQALEGFSWVLGKHTIKVGGSYTYHQWNRRGGPAPNGLFVYNGNETGSDFADFLLGSPDTFNQSSAQFLDARSKGGAVYAQDNFRALSNLTINYGLRWEFSQPWSDAQNKIQGFVPGQQSTVFADSPTGWLFPHDKGVPTTLAPTRWNNFAPRLGIAYSPAPESSFMKKLLGDAGQTSIRAAAGMFYTTLDTTGADFETGDAPFGFYYVSPSLVYMDLPFKGRSSGVDPGQRFPFVAPPLSGSPTYSFKPFLPIAYSPAFKNTNVLPYAIDFNMTIQRQLGKSTILSVGYVGTVGRKLFDILEFNAGNPQKCLQIAQIFATAGQGAGGCGPSGEDSIYQINGQTFTGTRPYSVTSGRHVSSGELDFGDNPYAATIGTSNYNSLQISLDKRVGPVRFLGAYTWAKSLDNASGFTESVNPYNPGLSRGLSVFDVTNNFVVSYFYTLPFDHWLPSKSGFAYRALSGWQINGITRLTSGLPVTLQETDDRSLCGCDGQGLHSLDLPNYSGAGIHRFNPRSTTSNQYIDTSVFSPMDLGVPGNANRRFFHGPGILNTDMGVQKDTRITERTSFELRAEFFNTFNHAQFLNPVGNYIASNFGQVTAARDPRIGQVSVKFLF